MWRQALGLAMDQNHWPSVSPSRARDLVTNLNFEDFLGSALETRFQFFGSIALYINHIFNEPFEEHCIH